MADTSVHLETWSQNIATNSTTAPAWLWQGFLAKGNTTLLTSLWKAGKTTLLSLLLARRKKGATLADLPVVPGKTAVISEEPLQLWADRSRRLDFGDNVCFFSRPFRGLPTSEQWQALIDRLLALHDQHGLDLAVIDPLAPFCPSENQARGMFAMLLPLAALTRAGMAVLLLHHPAKGDKPLGHAARGSGALLAHVDISIEMRHPGGDVLTRRRRFFALSRYAETPRQLLLELNPEGTDYLALPPSEQADFEDSWQVLHMVLEDAEHKLTRQQILDSWPADFIKPPRTTLWRWLDHALKGNLIAVDGTGRRKDPFRYWLPEREAIWRKDLLYNLAEEQRDIRRTLGMPTAR